jgi:transcriptional regulator with GAF, ATPase, and Fis domain/tetratricopeptide (TPR) repeat protein
MLLRNRYRVVERLGSGGMGSVFAVEDLRAGGARLALKALWAKPGDDSLVATLRAEFRVLAVLRHPRLCRVYDFGRLLGADLGLGQPEGADGYFITRDLVSGVDLDRAAQQCARDVAHVCQLVADAARSLDVLHRAGLRHGDVKPPNVIVDASDRAHWIDFGLAVGEHVRLSAGTLAYVAPEVLAQRPVDRRADLYSLGITLYQLLAGALPSGGCHGPELVRWHLEAKAPSVRRARSDVPPALDALVTRLCSRDPADRFPTAEEVACALDACVGKGGSPRPRNAPLVIAPWDNGQVGGLEAVLARRLSGAGGPALVEIVGDAGMGKTTLLTEFAWRAQLEGAEVVRADPAVKGRPLGAIGSLVEQVAALTGKDVNLPAEGTEATRHECFAALARGLAEAATACPLLLLLDDVDLADDASRALARYLAHALPARAPLLLCVTRRPLSDEDPHRTARVGEVPRVVLGPLGAAQVTLLVRSALGLTDEKLVAKILLHTAGNPLHVVETLAKLVERGYVPSDALRDLGVPARLEEVIAEDLAQATPEELQVLEALSVLSRPADEALLSAVTGSAVGAPAGALLRRGLVTRDVGLRLDFARPAMKQAVYERLPVDERRRWHAACVSALTCAHATDDELSWHDVRAGDRQQAGSRALSSARRLARAHDPAAALQLSEEILALFLAEGEEPARLRELRLDIAELARLLGNCGRVESVLSPFFEARGFSDSAASATQVCRARVILGQAREEAGDPDGAEALLRAVVDESPGSEESLVATRELVRILLNRGRHKDAWQRALEALAWKTTTRVQELEAARIVATGLLGEDLEAAHKLELLAAENPGDPALRSMALNFAAVLAFRAGDYPQAKVRYQTAMEAAQATFDLGKVGALRLNLAALAFHAGDYARCLEELTLTIGLFLAVGSDVYVTRARRNLGHLLVELGAYEQARAELSLVATSAARLRLPIHEAGAHALLGIVAARGGDLALGRSLLEKARALYAQAGDPRELAETWLDTAEIELDADPSRADLDAVARALGEAEKAQGPATDPAKLARRLAMASELALRRGDAAQATALRVPLREASDAVRVLGARHVEWAVRARLAVVAELLGEPAEAFAHRAAALGFLEAALRDLPTEYRASFFQDPRRRALRARVLGDTGQVSAMSPAALPAETPPGRTVTLERLHRVLEIYRRMSSERDVDRLLELIMDTAVELTSAERGFLLIATDGDGTLSVAVARNLPGGEAPLRSDSTRYSRSIAEHVFQTGNPVVTGSAQRDPRFDEVQSVHALHLESVLCIPVHARGRIVGVLYMESRFVTGRFSPEELRLLMAFGDQVAIALENARLLSENTRRAGELLRAKQEIETLLGERTELLQRRTEELAVARRDLEDTRKRLARGTSAFGIVGRSEPMVRVLHLIERIAETEVPVLIQGESGTGKELVARAIHEQGRRAKKPLVSLNCGALPETLLESELFGHVRGAFTGADRTRRGLFQVADGGTLFLDEVGDTPLRMQVALLRAVQEKIIHPVGATEDIKVDVRIVAATNRPLFDMVKGGTFREDLFYRLNVVAIVLPPLRERQDDIPLLVDHFLDVIAVRMSTAKKGVTRDAMRLLVKYPWPGNVRQLEHVLTNACVMADAEVLDAGAVGLILDPLSAAPGPRVGEERRDKEKQRILDALEASGWNKTRASEKLGMPRRTFYRRLEEYDIA